jgi:molybdate transport system substrate-binding protein
MRVDCVAGADDWTVDLRVWVENQSRVVLGKGRLELLEGIDRWHSISEAARQMGMSYRHAWLLVQSINAAAGEPFVVAATGGSHGGGAHLTTAGSWAVAVFRKLQEQVHQSADACWAQLVRHPDTASLRLAAAVSLEEVLGQLLADYTLQHPDVRVRTIFGASDELADHLLAGDLVDLFLAADARPLDRLDEAHLLESGSRTVFAENTLAAVAPVGRTVAVRKPTDLTRPGVTRIALAEPASPLGNYSRLYLKSLNLYDALLPRAVQVDNSRAVLATVRAGRADVGLVYGSDAAPAYGCQLLFRVRRCPAPIRYTAARVRRGQHSAQARDFLRFLTSPAAAHRFRQCGFAPADRASGKGRPIARS